jgi:predicted TPR repeat methyltransferase
VPSALRVGGRNLGVNLEHEPNDPIIACHLDALRGRARKRAPRLSRGSFDKYAPDLDRHLVEALDCRLPDKLHPLLVEMGMTFMRILDSSLRSIDASDVHAK